MTNKKISDLISQFCVKNILTASAGIIIDEKTMKATGEKDVYFSYPEAYAEDCKTIEDTYDDAEYLEGMKGLSGDPKEVSFKILKVFLVYTSIISSLTAMKDWDDDEVDEFIEFSFDEIKDFSQYGISIYGKPRVGEIWTKANMIETIKKVSAETEENLKKWKTTQDELLNGYQQLN